MVAASAGPKRWFFDVWSRIYDQPVVQRLTYAPVHQAVLRRLREVAPRRVLDLACGTGLLVARLHREPGVGRVAGVDFSHGMLRQAQSHDAAIPFVQASALALPFRDASFDAITSTEAFHWFPDQRRALAECFRVLAPGGRLLVALVDPPFEAMSDVVYAASRFAGQPFYWPTPERMRSMLEEAGFQVEAQERIFRLPAGLLLPPVLSVGMRPPIAA